MAYSKQSKRRFVQKAFWIRKDLARRLDKIVKARRKKEKRYSERVAFSLALRAHIEAEEQELNIVRRRRRGGEACPASVIAPQ